MPRLRQPSTLYDICKIRIWNYADQIAKIKDLTVSYSDEDIWIYEYLDHVDLPPRLCSDILNYNSENSSNFHILLFLHRNSKQIVVPDKCSYLLLAVLKKRLKSPVSLTFKDDNLDIILRGKLQELILETDSLTEFRTATADDKMLEILARRAPNLKVLDISGPRSKATSNGLRYLCGSDKILGCKRIETLDVSGCVHITPDGLLAVLTSIRGLVHLGATGVHGNLDCDFELNNIRTLKVDSLNILPRLRDIFPNLAKIHSKIYSSAQLELLPNLTNLSIENNTCYVVDEMISNIGPQLRGLSLSGIYSVDISAIIVHCPSLEELEIISPGSLDSRFMNFCSEKPPLKLRNLKLENIQFKHDILDILLEKAINLESICLKSVLQTEILLNASKQHGLSCLQELKAIHCGFLNKDTLLPILGLDNPLHKVDIIRCGINDTDRESVLDFIKSKNVDVNIVIQIV